MHTYLITNAAAQGGTTGSQQLELTTFQNVNVIGTLHLEYIATDTLTLQRVVNANTIEPMTLDNITVLTLTMDDPTININTFGTLSLALLPFVPQNLELIDLLSCFDQTYTTSAKIQMDTLITELKNAGVWTKFDWYGNAYWALSEHDALINWMNCPETLVKVGSASWAVGAGLSGTTPSSNSRYKSSWNVGDGAHSSATNFALFSKITDIAAPQNGMQPMGVWKRITGGGPSTPDGVFLSLSILAGTGFSGAWTMSGSGDGSFAVGAGGLGVWGVSHNGSAHITVHDGSTVASSTVLANADYTDADGMSVAGSSGAAKRSFPGTQLYWGWGGALTAVQFAAIESAFQTAILPPSPVVDALLINDDDDYLSEADGDYVIVDGP